MSENKEKSASNEKAKGKSKDKGEKIETPKTNVSYEQLQEQVVYLTNEKNFYLRLYNDIMRVIESEGTSLTKLSANIQNKIDEYARLNPTPLQKNK
jgi:outer membrane PBP1 activator LpoA protein